MKKIVISIIIVALVYGFIQKQGMSVASSGSHSSNAEITLQHAYKNRKSDFQVQGEGTVINILSDDLDGSRHQRFILKLRSGQTLLIAHNIDLAPRINNLRTGDLVEFYGEYEWNSKGGVIHWTHHDPSNRHTGG